ncbi:MAG TPA: LLM class F420-dependent oxidoreductase [Anaerolineales bacterium]|nr:LLM class F420-dependent oxidoreductase [Anaerolineales bacterium]
MKIGLQIPNFTYSDGPEELGKNLAEIARAAEDAGFSSIWVMDHFFQIGDRARSAGLGPVEDEMLEGYSTLSYLAGITKKVRLGTLVTGVVYRHPGILIKTVTTLDVLSGGRAYFGVGAAWNEREARGLGVPFPPVKERFERLEETLQIAKQMWSKNNGAYTGRHFQLAETLCNPQPLSRPHPPILIGGGGERKTLRLAAKYADACNLFARMGVETVRSKLDILKQHCEKVGRDYSDIEKTTLSTVHLAPDKMSAKDVIEECRALAGIGIQHAIFNMPNVHDIRPLETFGREIIPVLAEM